MPFFSRKVGVAEPQPHGMRDSEPDSYQFDEEDEFSDESFGPQTFLDRIAAVAEQEARGNTQLRASLARMRSRTPASEQLEPEPEPEKGQKPENSGGAEPEPEPDTETDTEMETETEPNNSESQGMYLLRTKSKRRRNSRKSEQLHAFINTLLVGLGGALVVGRVDESNTNVFAWATRLASVLLASLSLFCLTEGCQIYICPGKPQFSGGHGLRRESELGDQLIHETWAMPRCKCLSRTRSKCTDVVCLAFCGACMCYCVFVSNYLFEEGKGRTLTVAAGGMLFELGALGLLSLGFGIGKQSQRRNLESASSLEQKSATQRRNTMLFVNLVASMCTSLAAAGVAFNATAFTVVEVEQASSAVAHLVQAISLSVACLTMISALVTIKLLTIEGVVVKLYFSVASIVMVCSVGFVLVFAPLVIEVHEDGDEMVHLRQSVVVAAAVVLLNVVEAIVVCYRNEAPTLMLLLSCGWFVLGTVAFALAAAAQLTPEDADAVSREVSLILWEAQDCNGTGILHNETQWNSAAGVSRSTLELLRACEKLEEGFEVVAAGGFVVGITSIVRAICLACRRHFALKDRSRFLKRRERQQQRELEAAAAEATRKFFAQQKATLEKDLEAKTVANKKILKQAEANAQQAAEKTAKAEEQAAQDRQLAAHARQLKSDAEQAELARKQAEVDAAEARKLADAARKSVEAQQEVIWECDVDGMWHPYSKATSQILEQAYSSKGADPSFSERGANYSLDIKGMRQVNSKTGFARNVRRRVVGKQATIPSNWTAQPAGQNCELVDVNRGTAEFNAVRDRMRATMTNADTQIQRVQRVQNLLLWEYYCMRKELMRKRAGSDPNEVTVWHGTRAADPRVIYEDRNDGFMMQYSAQGMWGRGLYFAENASYSHGYANTQHSGAGQRSFFLTKLLAGEEVHLPSDNSLRLCPDKPGGGRYDTVTGTTGGSKVYIVYENGRAYPEYLVTYRG